MRNCQYLA